MSIRFPRIAILFLACGLPLRADVEVKGVLVHSGFNNNPGMEKVIEGSVSFIVNVPLETIVTHLEDASSLGRLSSNIVEYKASKILDENSRSHYAVEEDVVPTEGLFGIGKLAVTKLHLLMMVDRSMGSEEIRITWRLNPEKPQTWDRFEGRIVGFNLNDGHSIFMVKSSSQSRYDIPDGIKRKLVDHHLGKIKDNIVKWIENFGTPAEK